jgi:hypothetical protein
MPERARPGGRFKRKQKIFVLVAKGLDLRFAIMVAADVRKL